MIDSSKSLPEVARDRLRSSPASFEFLFRGLEHTETLTY